MLVGSLVVLSNRYEDCKSACRRFNSVSGHHLNFFVNLIGMDLRLARPFKGCVFWAISGLHCARHAELLTSFDRLHRLHLIFTKIENANVKSRAKFV